MCSFRTYLLIALVIAAFIGTSVGDENRVPPLQGWRIVDLTHELNDSSPVYPGSVGFRLKNLVPIEKGYYTNEFSMGEHVGTHVDAPAHFSADGKSMSRVSMQRLTGPLVVIDVKEEVAKNPDLAVCIKHIRRHEQKHGAIPPGAFVVANTGWASRWKDAKSYVNLGQDNLPHFPGFSESAAKYLANERKAIGMGIDTLSTDVGTSKDFPQHRAFLGGGGVNLENLTNLDKLPSRGAFLFVAPLKIGNGSGGPARVVAFLRNDRSGE